MEAPLCPEEESLLRHAVRARRREFALGRAAARAALAKLGVPVARIGVRADRTPIWPDGFVGSITHCDGFCGAVVARSSDIAGIGFDAEASAPLPDGVGRIIYGEEEGEHFSALPAINGLDWGKLAFSAKEAFYKCFFPLTQCKLNFRDVRVRFSVMGEFEIASDATKDFLDSKTQGRWLMSGGLVFTSFVKAGA